MTRHVLDAQTASKLFALREPTVLFDEVGRAIGYFNPSATPELLAEIEFGISEEEIQRRIREDARYSTAEVLEHLRKLG